MNFEIEKAITDGLNRGKDNFLVIWVNGLIAFLTSVLAAITIIGLIAIPAISGGYIESLLRIRKGENVEIGDFFTFGFNHFGAFLGLALLSFLGIAFGFLLLIIPGIFLSVAWIFAIYVKADNPNIPVTEALSMSMSLVSKVGWFKLFALLLIVTVATMVLNAFTFNFASLVIYPFTAMIYVEAYFLATDGGEPNDIKMINEVTDADVSEEAKNNDVKEDDSSLNEDQTEEIRKLKEKQARELEELKEIERLKEKQAKEMENLKKKLSTENDD